MNTHVVSEFGAGMAALPTRWDESGFGHASQATPALERLYRKQRLAGAFRLFGRRGFDMGGSGHISVRDAILTDHFWVNPLGVAFGRIRVSDLLLVTHDGRVVEGEGLLNQAAFAIHSAIHEARPDVHAAAHAHSLYGKAWSTLGRLLDPISQDSTAFYEDHALFDYSGIVLESEEGARIAQALGHKKALILQNHGLLTVGQSVESAVWRYISMDNAAQTQLLAEAAGEPKLIPHATAQNTRRTTGSETAGFFGFQIYWQSIVEQEADLLE